MRTSVLLSAGKQSWVGICVVSLAAFWIHAGAFAATPVDVYQDMEGGNAGDTLTSTLINGTSHGGGASWGTSNTMFVSTINHRDLPGPVIVGGVTYNGTGGTRSWMFNENNQLHSVNVTIPGSYPNVTIACYYSTGLTRQYLQFDSIAIHATTNGADGAGGVFEVESEEGGPTAYRLESDGPLSHNDTDYSPQNVHITLGKPYWVNLHWDGIQGYLYGAVFDPDNGFAQVGTTMRATSIRGSVISNSYPPEISFARTDGHGNYSEITSQGYFDQILIDYTNAAFPLLPSGYNDSTAPGATPVVRDGTGDDQSIALSTTQLSANWDPAWDAESGIKGYQYAIGTTQGATNVVNWTTVSNVLTVTRTGLSLTTGQTYYFSVKAINGAGLTGSAANSNGQTVGTDTTAPSAPSAVRDGSSPGKDIDETHSTTELDANFDPGSDAESGISCYQYAVGTTLGGTQTMNWTPVPANTYLQHIGAKNLSLTPGQRYYFSMKSVNNAGLVSSAVNSDGQTVVNTSDTTPPSAPPTVRDGLGSDISTQSLTTQLSANWDPATDNQSGISGYKYAIGTTPGGTNVVNYSYNTTLDGSVLSATKTGLSLTVGQTYYFTVLALNGVGITGSATSSNGVTIGTGGGNQAPSAPANVRDGTGSDITYTTSNTQLSANWDASTDPDGSVTAYQYAIGTSTGGTQTLNWTTLGNVTTVTKTGLSLTNGQTYYFSVKAVDNQGLAGNATNSNGQTVDTTVPSAPANVRDGTGTDISTTSSTTQLSANWDASTDNESGISGYQYAIGTSAGGTQTVNWTSLGNVTTVTKTGSTLSVGQTYYFSVKAVNGAGLVGSPTNSNGQTIVTATDTTPPSAPPNVRDGVGADISTTNSTTQLSANWDASTDNESGISGYQYAIGTSAGGTQTVNWTSLGNVTTVTKTGLTLTVGQTYFFSIRAVNGAGLTGGATNSNGQTVVSASSVIYFSDNFESWTVHGGAWSSISGESSTQILDTSTDFAKAGAKSLKLTDNDTTAASNACLTKNFSPAIADNLYVRFFIYLPSAYVSANNGAASRRLLRVWCQSNRGQMSLYSGATPLMEEIGAWGSPTAPSALSADTWHCIEMYMATPSASTAMQYWIDGTSAGTLTGSFSGSTAYDHIDFGDVCVGSGTNADGTFYFDELVVSNSYVGTGITSPVTYFSDNFENWAVHGGAWSSVNGETSTHTLNTSTDYAKAGTKSLKLTDTDTTATDGAYLSKTFSPAISGDAYVRFYLFLPTGYGSTNVNCSRRLLAIYSGSNRAIFVATGDVGYSQESIGWTSGAGTPLSENAWHCIEMHVTAPAAVTVLEWWLDGVYVNAITPNFSAGSTWSPICLGDTSISSGGNNGTGTFYLDEVIMSNAYNGPLP